MTKHNEMVEWCAQNISPVAYYIPTGGFTRRGGVGWAMYQKISGQHFITIDDPELLVIFLLKFGHTGIKVADK